MRYADEEDLRQAFFWHEDRTPDKAGVFSLFGEKYQTRLGRRRIQVRFDPEALDLVEVWLGGQFQERVRPFEVSTHRRPHVTRPEAEAQAAAPPIVDWLSHLIARREEQFLEPTPRQLVEQAASRRHSADDAIVDLFARRLDEDIFDEAALRDWLLRFGPVPIAPVPTTRQKRRLRSHFGFSKLPFGKTMWAAQMFDSQSQRELLDALLLWSDVKGVALVTGPTGVGKSITLRRFVAELDEARFRVIDFTYLPATPTGPMSPVCQGGGGRLRLLTKLAVVTELFT